MTVAELREALEQMCPDDDVVFHGRGSDWFKVDAIETVRIRLYASTARGIFLRCVRLRGILLDARKG